MLLLILLFSCWCIRTFPCQTDVSIPSCFYMSASMLLETYWAHNLSGSCKDTSGQAKHTGAGLVRFSQVGTHHCQNRLRLPGLAKTMFALQPKTVYDRSLT